MRSVAKFFANMNSRFSNITGVILVGGKSRRIGRDKAFLLIDGLAAVERVIQVMQGCFQQLLLVGDRPERFERYRLPVLPDIYPGSSLGGLYTGLSSAATDRIFVSACDIPFPDSELIRLICREADCRDAVIPATEGGLEPLFGLYHKSCLPLMQAALEAGNYRITALLGQVRVKQIDQAILREVDPSGRGLLNMNTPEEYAVYKEFAR